MGPSAAAAVTGVSSVRPLLPRSAKLANFKVGFLEDASPWRKKERLNTGFIRFKPENGHDPSEIFQLSVLKLITDHDEMHLGKILGAVFDLSLIHI